MIGAKGGVIKNAREGQFWGNEPAAGAEVGRKAAVSKTKGQWFHINPTWESGGGVDKDRKIYINSMKKDSLAQRGKGGRAVVQPNLEMSDERKWKKSDLKTRRESIPSKKNPFNGFAAGSHEN